MERAGALLTHELAEFARSRDDYLEYLAHRGGLFSHFGMRDVERIAEGVKNGEIDSMPLEAYIAHCKILIQFQGWRYFLTEFSTPLPLWAAW